MPGAITVGVATFSTRGVGVFDFRISRGCGVPGVGLEGLGVSGGVLHGGCRLGEVLYDIEKRPADRVSSFQPVRNV